MLTSVIFLAGVLEVATIVLAFEVFGSEDAGAAWLNAAIGVGAAAGSVLAVVLIGRRHLAPSIGRGLLLSAVSVALIPIVESQAVALSLWPSWAPAGPSSMCQVGSCCRGSSCSAVSPGPWSPRGNLHGRRGARLGGRAVLIGWLGVGWALVVASLLIIVVLLGTAGRCRRPMSE